MKSVFLLVVVLFGVANCQFKNAAPLLARSLLTRAAPVCPVNTYNNLCAADCKSLMKCTGDTTPASYSICTGSKPYCVGTECVAEQGPDPACNVANSNEIVCKQIGVFPDPFDCTRFYKCDAAPGPAVPYFCLGTNMVYDAKLEDCKPKTKSSQCVNMHKLCSSSSNANKFITFSPYPRYYAYCSHIGVKETTMYVCAEGLTFNVKTGICEVNCNGVAGTRLPGKECYEYYQCTLNNKIVTPVLHNCSPLTPYFDAADSTCVAAPAGIPCP